MHISWTIVSFPSTLLSDFIYSPFRNDPRIFRTLIYLSNRCVTVYLFSISTNQVSRSSECIQFNKIGMYYVGIFSSVWSRCDHMIYFKIDWKFWHDSNSIAFIAAYIGWPLAAGWFVEPISFFMFFWLVYSTNWLACIVMFDCSSSRAENLLLWQFICPDRIKNVVGGF